MAFHVDNVWSEALTMVAMRVVYKLRKWTDPHCDKLRRSAREKELGGV